MTTRTRNLRNRGRLRALAVQLLTEGCSMRHVTKSTGLHWHAVAVIAAKEAETITSRRVENMRVLNRISKILKPKT